MIGKVLGACFISSGNILVVDDVSQDLRLFSRDGTCIQRTSHRGAGPYQYVHIGGITPFGEGFALFEDFLRRYVFFDCSLTPVEYRSPPGTQPFIQLAIFPDSSILTQDIRLDRADGRATLSRIFHHVP
jgi:hypothetical protein